MQAARLVQLLAAVAFSGVLFLLLSRSGATAFALVIEGAALIGGYAMRPEMSLAAAIPGVAAALDFLADTDWAGLDDGRYEVDGEKGFVNVMRYETKMDNPTPERQEKYIDIFYLLEGEEEAE